MPESKHTGYYSPAAAELHGTVFWTRPDGTEVEITAAMSVESELKYGWDDAVCVGSVVDYVRHGKDGSNSRYN